MADTNATAQLKIRTVPDGFYCGFNLVVAVATKAAVMGIVVLLVAAPAASRRMLALLRHVTITGFAGWYIYLLASFVAFCLILVVLPVSSRVKLGPDGAIPEHSTPAWLSMMFCAGIGVGILAFSVSEPVSEFQSNPDILSGAVAPASPAALASAMRYVFLHWGLSAWGCYAIVAMALGLSCHRFGQPMTMRSALAALFGRRLEGIGGHLVDVISLLAIIAGITTTIVLGLQQICSGLSAVTGSPFFADKFGDPPLAALMTALIVTISVALASILSGPHRGIKWVSQLGILLAFGLLLVFILFGGHSQVFSLLARATMDYVTSLPAEIVTVYDAGPARAWQDEWTVFYWAWWIAFAPFVGLFLARISFGRSLREFILGAMLAPAAMCFIWFAGTGGSALLMVLDGRGGGRILSAEHAFRIYAAVDTMFSSGPAAVVKAVIIFMFLVLIVASATAAIVAIKSIGAAGSAHGETPFHSLLWALVIAVNTGAVMAVGGVASIRDVMIVGAVPFSFIMALMLVSVVLMIIEARSPGRTRIARLN